MIVEYGPNYKWLSQILVSKGKGQMGAIAG